MAVGDIFRVALAGGLYGQQIVNVFHYRQTTNNTSALSNVQSLANAFNAGMVGAIVATQAVEASYGTVEARTFNPPSVPLEGYDLPIVVVGEKDGPALPPTVCAVIRKRTPLLGRKNRGRNYYAGVDRADVLGGSLTSAAIAGTWSDLKDAIIATIAHTITGSPSFAPVLAALDASAIVAPVGVRWQPLVSAMIDPVLRVQRRREIGVGA